MLVVDLLQIQMIINTMVEISNEFNLEIYMIKNILKAKNANLINIKRL